MASTGHSDQYIARAWARVQLAASASPAERCPENNTEGINTDALAKLARDGFIRILISGQNWRTVHILKGPHSGKSTLADPTGGRIYKIIGAFGTQMIRKPVPTLQTPSLPRLLTDPKNSDTPPPDMPRGRSG